MAKFFGAVGFIESVETAPGVWQEVPHERSYFGDVIRNTRRYQDADQLNNNLMINNIISIVADEYAYDHFYALRYIEWQGVKWHISYVEVKRPRLELTIGGVYNDYKGP